MDTISTENLSKIITNAKSYAIITHRRPDGDAISSSLAIFWYLIDIGKLPKDIDVIIPEFLNDFSFIPGIEHLKKEPTKENYDVLIVVDCANMHLLEKINLFKFAKQIICFDHHEETYISDLLDSEKNLNTVNHKAIITELQKSIKYTFLILLIENEKVAIIVILQVAQQLVHILILLN